MTVREYLNQLSDEDFAHWLCKQIWEDYSPTSLIGMERFHVIRNFLKSELKPEQKPKQEDKEE